jgi:hypothetical protein
LRTCFYCFSRACKRANSPIELAIDDRVDFLSWSVSTHTHTHIQILTKINLIELATK